MPYSRAIRPHIRQHDALPTCPLLYVQQQGGWRRGGVLLQVYARWLPQKAPTVTVLPPAQSPAQSQTS